MKRCETCSEELTKRSQAKYCSNACQASKEKTKIRERWLDGGSVRPRQMKRILIEDRGHQCEVCEGEHWMDELIPLEVHHIDGNPRHSPPENMQLICPNCHAQTDTYNGANKGNGLRKR